MCINSFVVGLMDISCRVDTDKLAVSKTHLSDVSTWEYQERCSFEVIYRETDSWQQL